MLLSSIAQVNAVNPLDIEITFIAKITYNTLDRHRLDISDHLRCLNELSASFIVGNPQSKVA